MQNQSTELETQRKVVNDLQTTFTNQSTVLRNQSTEFEKQRKVVNDLKSTVIEQNTEIDSVQKDLKGFVKNQSSAVEYEVGDAVCEHLKDQGEEIVLALYEK